LIAQKMAFGPRIRTPQKALALRVLRCFPWFTLAAGLGRATVKIGIAKLAYNFRRLISCSTSACRGVQLIASHR